MIVNLPDNGAPLEPSTFCTYRQFSELYRRRWNWAASWRDLACPGDSRRWQRYHAVCTTQSISSDSEPDDIRSTKRNSNIINKSSIKTARNVYLVMYRLDFAIGQQTFQLLGIEIGDTNVFDQAKFHKLLHRTPGVHIIDIAEGITNFLSTVPFKMISDLPELHFALGIGWHHFIITTIDIGIWPVHQVEIHIVQTKVLQCLATSSFNSFRFMEVAPKLIQKIRQWLIKYFDKVNIHIFYF